MTTMRQAIRDGLGDWSLIHHDQYSRHQPSAGPVPTDVLAFPTAWRLVREGVVHTDRRCSYVRTWGAFLCDCNGIGVEWTRRAEGSR